MAMKAVSSEPSRYSRAAQFIHRATAVLVLVEFLYGPGGPESRVYDVSRDADRHLHETLGSLVFVLVIIRVVWRLVDRRPEPTRVARWMGMAVKASQLEAQSVPIVDQADVCCSP